MARDFNRSMPRGGFISMRMDVRERPRAQPTAWREDLLRDLVCDQCARRYGVYAIAVFCPDCAAPNLGTHFKREVELVTKQVELAGDVREERDRELAYRLLGNAHEDVLTAFETYLKTTHRWFRRRDLIVWNPVFGQVALDCRFAPELCWPRAAQQKGTVENLVGWAKKSFFRCRRFHDRADLEVQLAQWLTSVNTQRPNRATGEIPITRLPQERARLRPLPLPAAAYALKIPVVVSARSRVRHDGHEYSMPLTTLGQTATLHLYPDHVEIVTRTGQRHPRGPERLSLLPEHRAAMLDAVRGGRARLYYQRQSLWELGPAAEAWHTELVHRRPTQWRRDVERCFDLLQTHGPARVLAGFAWGVAHYAIGAENAGTDAAPQRPQRHRQDPPGRRHCLPRDPEWLRSPLHLGDGPDRRALDGYGQGAARPGPAQLHASPRAGHGRGRLPQLRARRGQRPLPGRQRPLPAPPADDLHH